MNRVIVLTAVVAMLICEAAVGQVKGASKAEIVSTVLVWNQATYNIEPTLIRFDDRWILACRESAKAGYPGGEIRVLTSADGKMWGPIALIESPTPKRRLYGPTFTQTRDDRLLLSAVGTLPSPNIPLPKYGGVRKTLAWDSQDGRDWGEHQPIGSDNFPLERIVWHDGAAFSPAYGRICGSATTIQVMVSKDGTTFESRYKETLSELMPYEAELLFAGDSAHCLVTGYSTAGPTGLLGIAKAPYQAWKWTKLDQPVRHARFIRLAEQQILAAVGLYDGKERTSLCEFDPATGKFTELLVLPTGGKAVVTDLAWHDGHLWVSYPVADMDKHRLYLAQVKLR